MVAPACSAQQTLHSASDERRAEAVRREGIITPLAEVQVAGRGAMHAAAPRASLARSGRRARPSCVANLSAYLADRQSDYPELARFPGSDPSIDRGFLRTSSSRHRSIPAASRHALARAIGWVIARSRISWGVCAGRRDDAARPWPPRIPGSASQAPRPSPTRSRSTCCLTSPAWSDPTAAAGATSWSRCAEPWERAMPARSTGRRWRM